jgi:hypothetical protein
VASFQATLDDSHYVPGSGYFDVKDALIQDNYHAGQLTCVGASLTSEIKCVGYDNGVGGTIFDVTISPSTAGTPTTASYRFIDISADPVARSPQTKGPWRCNVTDFE